MEGTVETPPKGDIKSHHVSGLSEELLTPSSSGKDVKEAMPEVSNSASPATKQEGGGVTGYIKSLIGGGGQQEAPHPDQKTTHSQEMGDGTTTAVHTAPESTAVPDTLKDGPQTVGAAKTQIQEPMSEYAPALEGIAGPAEAPDPTAKYGPALGAITGEAPAQGAGTGTGTGVVGAVTAAAGSVVQTVKHAVGYEDEDPTATGEATEGTKAVEQPITGTQATEPTTGSTSTGVVTPSDLPKSGVVSSDGTGSADIAAKEQPGYLSSAAGAVSGAATGLKNTVTGFVGGGGETAGTEGKPAVQYEGGAPTAAAVAKDAPSSTTAPSAETTSPAATSAAPAAATAAAGGTAATDAKGAATAGDAKDAAGKATSAEGSSVSGAKGDPPVSAFASDSTTPAGEKTGEIVEDAGTKKASQPASGMEAAGIAPSGTKAEAAAKKGKEADKTESKCCGCVIQ